MVGGRSVAVEVKVGGFVARLDEATGKMVAGSRSDIGSLGPASGPMRGAAITR